MMNKLSFTPIIGTVQHGHFALAATPSYVLNSFQQGQIDSHDIVFIPDGSSSTAQRLFDGDGWINRR